MGSERKEKEERKKPQINSFIKLRGTKKYIYTKI